MELRLYLTTPRIQNRPKKLRKQLYPRMVEPLQFKLMSPRLVKYDGFLMKRKKRLGKSILLLQMRAFSFPSLLQKAQKKITIMYLTQIQKVFTLHFKKRRNVCVMAAALL